MVCPLCKIGLEEAIFYNIGVSFCPKCLGIFFEEDELRWAKDEKDENLNWLDIDLWKEKTKFKIYRGIRLCPLCRLPLYEVYYGDSRVIVDLCNLCQGIWLDRGEFKRIMEYLKKKGSYEILNNYAKNLAKEFWEIFTGPESLKEEIEDFLTILKILNYKFTVQHPTLSGTISQLPK